MEIKAKNLTANKRLIDEMFSCLSYEFYSSFRNRFDERSESDKGEKSHHPHFVERNSGRHPLSAARQVCKRCRQIIRCHASWRVVTELYAISISDKVKRKI